MIKSIRLVNWKTHGDTYLDFQKGTNVIVGLMGAGKSSMMDAISFALFGTFPALEHRRYKVEDIIMNRPSQKDSASVELELDIGDDLYKISRTISRSKKNDAKIEKNGKYLQTQPERVTEEVESILKINYDVFSRAIYAEQNRLDYFLELRKGERKKQIDEMLGLDRFALAEENATSLVNALKTLTNEDEKFIQNSDLPSMKSKLESLSKELEKEKDRSLAISEDVKKMRDELSATKQYYSEIKAQNEKRLAFSKSIAELESKLSTLKSQLGKIELPKSSATVLLSTQKQKSEELKALDSEIDSYRKKEKDLISKLSSLKAELKRSLSDAEKLAEAKKKLGSADPDSIRKEISAKQAEIKESVSQAAKSRSELAETKKWLDELAKQEGKCPICERPLSDDLKKHISSERKKMIEVYERDIELSKQKYEKAEKELSDLNSRLAEANRLAAMMESYSESASKSGKLEPEIKGFETELSEISLKISQNAQKRDEIASQMEKIRNDIEAIKRADSIKAEMASSEAEKKSKMEEMSRIKVTDSDIEALREKYNELNAEYAKKGTELNALKESSSKLESQISETAKSISQIMEMEEKVNERRKRSLEVSRFKSALIDTESQLRTRLVSSINELLEGLWIGLYPYGDYSGIALKAYPDDYALEAEIRINGKDSWLPVEGVTSGGERSIASLALRIAMSMVIVPNLRWLILDEPTHNLDAQGIAKMIEVFSNSLPSIVEQIFVITHDDALKQVHNARIYEFDRDKALNGPTEINTG
ncbi:MAG: AAA family ATPase [Candidatus Marsarchaeota archaeon]|nr:AAA family ATPase [Candidatus Marsarchaeota archaeon]